MLRSSVVAMLLCCIALLSFVSAQAQCGPGLGSCTGTNCCSGNGYCGVGEQYCGATCQAGFGVCGGGVVSPSGPPPATGQPSASIPTSPALPTITSTTSEAPVSSAAPITSSASPSSAVVSSSTTTRGTFQLQPTSKPNGASSTTSTDKGGVGARLALSVVFMALLLI